MGSILVPLDVPDEQRMINRVAIQVALVRYQLSKEFSREWLETTLRRYLREGLIAVIKVVEAADRGDELADAALREIGAELFEAKLLEQPSNRPGDLQILAYFQRAGLRDRCRRRRGAQW